MLERIYADFKGLEITWKGKIKNKTTGKEKDTMQTMRTSPNGMKETFFMDSIKPLDALKVGDSVDATVQVRAYKDGLFLTIMEIAIAQAQAMQGKK